VERDPEGGPDHRAYSIDNPHDHGYIIRMCRGCQVRLLKDIWKPGADGDARPIRSHRDGPKNPKMGIPMTRWPVAMGECNYADLARPPVKSLRLGTLRGEAPSLEHLLLPLNALISS